MASLAKDLDAARRAFAQGDLALAQRCLGRVLRQAPRHAAANELMAYTLARLGDKDAAHERLVIATTAADAPDTAWYYLGVSWMLKGTFEQARAAFSQALARNPRFFEAAHDLGRALHEQGRFEPALQAFESAIALRPESYEAWHNYGRALAEAGRWADAVAAYDHALTLEPASPETWLNRGHAHRDAGRPDHALASYRKALELRPGFPEAVASEAVALLALGDYESGWSAFESRWHRVAPAALRHGAIPRWTANAPLAGKRILVWSEQGLGDTIQFSRYVPLLQERGAQAILEVQPDLKPIFARSFDCEVYAVGEALPRADLQIPFVSLAHAFSTTLSSVPAAVPYLRGDPARDDFWRERLGPERGDEPRVALACSGRVAYRYENQRRVRLREFASLSRCCRLVLAQRDLHDDDRAALDEGIVRADFLGADMHDFRDAAAITRIADLVISVDTSLAHVAGALARPVWVMLSHAPDWRWMMQREDSPWYPTARLLRQRQAGDWAAVVRRIEADLATLYPSGPSTR